MPALLPPVPAVLRALAGLAGALASIAAAAQPATDERLLLDEVDVSGNTQPDALATARVPIVTRRGIRQHDRLTLAQVLRGVRGFSVTGDLKHACVGARRAALVAVAATLALPAAAQAPRVLVVTTGDAAPYESAIDGVKRALPGQAVEVRMLAPATRDALAASLARLPRETAVIAIGSHAAEFVGAAAPGATGASCLVLGATRGGPEPRVPLDVPAEAQASTIRRVLPAARTVALLHDPVHNARRVAELAAALERGGLRALVEPVASPADLPRALERVGSTADVLLALPDPTVYARESARGLLTFSFRRRVPIAAYSEAWVRAGALFALDWDYAEVGAWCAALATRSPATRAPLPPAPRPKLVLNLRSAAQLRIAIDPEVVRQAERVHD